MIKDRTARSKGIALAGAHIERQKILGDGLVIVFLPVRQCRHDFRHAGGLIDPDHERLDGFERGERGNGNNTGASDDARDTGDRPGQLRRAPSRQESVLIECAGFLEILVKLSVTLDHSTPPSV